MDRIENLQYGICSQGHIRFYERKYGMLLLILNKSMNINLYLYLGILMIYREKYNFCEKSFHRVANILYWLQGSYICLGSYKIRVTNQNKKVTHDLCVVA